MAPPIPRHPYPAADRVACVPRIASPWWQVTIMPALGELAGPDPARQDIVDHSLIRAANGRWQLWACLRGTAVSRLIYGWEGDSLEQGPWEERGVQVRAEARYGEPTSPEAIGAPYFIKDNDQYYCFYHAGQMRLMTSPDGIHYTRRLGADGTAALACPGGRDAMVFKEDGVYYLYYCITSAAPDGLKRNLAVVVLSEDLQEWSDYIIVSEGGVAGNGGVSAESPFVVKHDGYYYLFRASSITFQTYVYRSTTPLHFGINDDAKLITILPIKAPEIVLENGQYYISDLADFKGIRMAKLAWDAQG